MRSQPILTRFVLLFLVGLPAPGAADEPTPTPPGVLAVLGDRSRQWDVVRALAYDPEGNLLVSASDEGTLCVRDPLTGRVRAVVSDRKESPERNNRRLSGATFELTFSPDGKTLVGANGDRTLHRYKVADWSESKPIKGHKEGIFSTRFVTPAVVATAADDQTIRLWDLEAGTARATIELPGGFFSALATEPSRGWLAAGTWDKTIRIYADEGKNLIGTLRGHEARVLGLGFSPDGKTFISGDAAGTVRTWDTSTWSERQAQRAHDGPVLALAFAADGQSFATAGADGAVQVWGVAGTGIFAARRTLRGHQGPVLTLAFHPSGSHLATGGVDATVRVWDLAAEPSGPSPSRQPGAIVSVAYAPDGRAIAAGDDAGFVRVWDATDVQIRLTFEAHQGRVGALGFAPDSGVLATGGADGPIRLWDPRDGQPLGELVGHAGEVHALAISRDGARLASAGADKTLRLWDVAKRQLMWDRPAHAGAVLSVAFSPDGQSLATAGKDRFLRIWDAHAGRRRAEVEPEMGADPCFVAFHPDSTQFLAAGYGDATVKLFNATTGQPGREFGRHRGETLAAAFSADGKTIVSSGRDGTVRFWTAEDGKTQGALSLHAPRGAITRLALNPTGDRVVTVNGDGTAFLADPARRQILVEKVDDEP